jgi:metal-responsive CopG/Arc/MetJ family transcriptional regulator
VYTRQDVKALPEVLETRPDALSHSSSNRSSNASSIVSVRLPSSLKSAIDSRASALGISRSAVVARCLESGLEALPSRHAVAPGGIEECLRRLSETRHVFFGINGPLTMGILRLLARWAAEIGGLKGVPEEELLEEVWSVGAGEWEQAAEESEADPPDPSGVALKERFRVEPGPTNAQPSLTTKQRMPKPDVRFDLALLRRVDAFAGSEGITRSRAIRELCGMGLDLVESEKSITQGRIDELLEAIESEKRLMAHLGTTTVVILQLLAHWAAQTGGLRVPEDEFVAEVRTAGHEEWERIFEEATRRLREASAEGGR